MVIPNNKYTFKVELEPLGKRVELDPEKTIANATLMAGLDLVTSCNCLGICGTCKVRLLNGTLTPLTDSEKNKLSSVEIEEGVRLACQVSPTSDVKVFIPPSSLTQGQQLQLDGKQFHLPFAPAISFLDITLDLPNMKLQDIEFQQIQKVCRQSGFTIKHISERLLQSLTQRLQDNKGSVRLIFRQAEIINILPAGIPFFGLALDIGSTKIAVYLVDLSNGSIVEQIGLMNPQIQFGEDVVNRISFANRGILERIKLQNVLVQTINQHIDQACQKIDINHNQIVDMVVVGNTVIHHLFCGFPVKSLGESPYNPAEKGAISIPADEIGINIAEGSLIYLPPIIAGYVGADHTAAIMATRLNFFQETVCLIDVGTNTEISLIHQNSIYSCSCASGPAFEGAHIQDGMRAAPGAIEKVTIHNNLISFQTINQKTPVGICGSGILSAVAEMQKSKIIDQRGVFQEFHPLTRKLDGQKFLILVEKNESGNTRNILVNRKDVNEIQLAKGAIRSGIEIVCRKAGIKPKDVAQYLIAGAFGTHLDLESAIEIGMFPDVDISRYQQIGNAAGVGAREFLINAPLRKQAEEVVNSINYIELTTEPSFSDIYVQSLSLERNDVIN